MVYFLVVDLPKAYGEIAGCWYGCYPVHSGDSKESINHATVYASTHKIVPKQDGLRTEFENFVRMLSAVGFTVRRLPFPAYLNAYQRLHYDAVFGRDPGIEEYFSAMEIERHVAPPTWFWFAGGSGVIV
jgi:hypothetical protein